MTSVGRFLFFSSNPVICCSFHVTHHYTLSSVGLSFQYVVILSHRYCIGLVERGLPSIIWHRLCRLRWYRTKYSTYGSDAQYQNRIDYFFGVVDIDVYSKMKVCTREEGGARRSLQEGKVAYNRLKAIEGKLLRSSRTLYLYRTKTCWIHSSSEEKN